MNEQVRYIFENNSSGHAAYEMSEEEFNEIQTCNKVIFHIYRFEEIFCMLMDSVFTFNNVFFRYADRARFMNIIEENNFQKVVDVNQTAVSFFSTLQMFCDYVNGDKILKNNSSIIKMFEANELKRCRALRNYIQHVENLYIIPTTQKTRCNEILLISIRFLVPKTEIQLDKLHGNTRNMFEEAFREYDSIDLYQVISEGFDQIQKIQDAIRKASELDEKYKKAKESLLQVAKRLINYSDMYNKMIGDEWILRDGLFIAEKTIQQIETIRKLYPCRPYSSGQYITNAPKEFVDKCRKLLEPAMLSRLSHKLESRG